MGVCNGWRNGWKCLELRKYWGFTQMGETSLEMGEKWLKYWVFLKKWLRNGK